jgi:hypothetical protein
MIPRRSACSFQSLSAACDTNHDAKSLAALSLGQKGLDWNPRPSDDLTYLERNFLC